MQIRNLLFLVWQLGLSSLVVASVASAQAPPPFLTMPDIGFEATDVEGMPVGIHYSVESGRTGGPYRTTQFFEGIASTEGGGRWAKRDNAWGICFNLVNCTGQRILPDMYDFSFVLESDYQGDPSWPTMIEQNFNMRYPDGTFHRPFAMHIRSEEKNAVFNFSSKPGEVSLHINQNGKTVIGNPSRQPIKQLEVEGDALVTRDLQVDGELTVDGLPVLVSSESASSGALRWGLSDGDATDSANDVCQAARLECTSAMLPRGQTIDCSQPIAAGLVFFALCR